MAINLSASISFPGTIACGGAASLVLNPDGTYVFHGSLHDSGFVPYDVAFAIVVSSKSGRAFTFSKTGHVDGTINFTGGGVSRDFSWTDNGTNQAIAAAWTDFVAGYDYHWKADVNVDLPSFVKSVVALVPIVQSVVAVI